MKEAASNQPQVADASHVLVFAAWDTYTAERINYMFDLTNEVRGFTNDGWENYRQFLLNTYVPKSAEKTSYTLQNKRTLHSVLRLLQQLSKV